MTEPADQRMMTPQTRFILLLLLQDTDRECTVGEIARRLGFWHGTTNAIMIRLEQNGWVNRRVENSRLTRCRLTYEGAVRAQAALNEALTPTFAALAESLNLSTEVLTAPITIPQPPPDDDPEPSDDEASGDEAQIARELGAHLRSLRRQHRWTRKQLLDQLGIGPSIQTLATWELGTRAMSVVRLFQVCRGLGVPPHEVIAHTEQVIEPPDVRVDNPAAGVMVNLARLADVTRPELAPARRWADVAARGRLTPLVLLDAPALAALAELCGLKPVELIDAIREVHGDHARRV